MQSIKNKLILRFMALVAKAVLILNRDMSREEAVLIFNKYNEYMEKYNEY